MAEELDDVEDVEVDEEENPALAERASDISRKPGIRKQMLDIFAQVEEGYTDQHDRVNDTLDYWDIYNCKLSAKQFYNGNSRIFVPIVHNAVNARVTRFTNQIFPQNNRCVEAITENSDIPHALVALLEHYVRRTKLRTVVMPALLKNGDVEGQYNLYVDWKTQSRHVVWRTEKPAEIEPGIPNPAAEPVEDIAMETVEVGLPDVEVLADSDVLILPPTVDTVDEALAVGGSVSIIRRWTKGQIRQKIRDGAIRKDAGEVLMTEMQESVGETQNRDKAKAMIDAAGIHGKGRGKHALVYETWTVLKTGKDERRICQAFYGGGEKILGCRRNPNWSDKTPIISSPVKKIAGSFKGQSGVKPCADMQYAANDAVNEGMDSAAYALMPIVMTDPEKNPRVGSMVLSLAAVWETSPKDTQFAQFPALWEGAFAIVSSCTAQISQTLSVSPAAITQGAGVSAAKGSRPNQADVAREQQVDILTTADAVTVLEEGVLTPILERFIELDHQYRDKALTVRQYGEMGMRANMEVIKPVQFDTRYEFRWYGVEQARNAQAIQQQIGALNVIRGIPPQQYMGYRLDLTPVITNLVEVTFGPRLAPLVFKSNRDELSVDPKVEDKMLAEGFELPAHPGDNDPLHIQSHIQAMQAAGGDPSGVFRAHLMAHQQNIEIKTQAAMAQAASQGMPGVPGGAQPSGQPAPGVAGTPRIGAQPGQPRNQGPPGQIHQDRMKDPSVMPRKVG